VIPRSYQLQAIDAVLNEFETVDTVLLVMATGCVSGESVIGVNRAGKGYSRPIAAVHDSATDPRRRADVDTYVRSHIGDRIGLHRAEQVLNSGVKETMTLDLENGRSLRATYDHEILTENGFVALWNLKGTDRVVCESPPVTGRAKKAKCYYRMIQGLRFHPFSRGSLFRVALHRLVCEARLNGISLDELVEDCRNSAYGATTYSYLDPAVWAVHHRNGEHLDNCPDNLEVLTHSDHHRLHGQTDKLANLGMGLIEASPVVGTKVYGLEPTYDIVCDDPHRNFVANGIVVHNCGKTICFSHIISRMPHKRVMVLAHREELIRQAAAKIYAVTGEQPEIEMAGERADLHLYRRARVVVSTVQTQLAGGERQRMEKFNPADFGLVIADEAHHYIAPSFRRVLDYYRQGGAKVLGVTATPDRADEAAMGKVFASAPFVYEINDGIKDGWLVPIRQRMVKVQSLDFSKVRTTAGDLNGADLARVMEEEKILHEVAGPTIELAGTRKTIIFAATVAQAERVAEIINRRVPDAARWVCGETKRDVRAQTLRDYTVGRFQFLANVGVLTEGYDEPTVEMVVMARPTKSRALYCQCIGRGTRPLAGIVDGIDTADGRRAAIASSAKPNIEILDFAGNSGKHKLISSADILGGNYEDDVVDRAAKKARESKTGVNMAEALEEAKVELHKEREAEKERDRQKRRAIAAKAEFKTKTIDPFEVLDIEPARERGWDAAMPATEKQVAVLEKMGVPTKDLSKNKANKLITELFNRRTRGLCTYRQSSVLGKYGYPTDVSFAKAKQLMDVLAKNGWKRPATPPPPPVVVKKLEPQGSAS
jgi:superfamily II DNA or RNA helicase